ncbi:MAG: NUDIX hydrolase [Thermaceae bacterium]|nr:NUDIX hydrolase [Thermaceae bacterium]
MIVLEQNGIRFNYRVAGVAIKNAQVLLCCTSDGDFWYLPGGRVELGEESRAALRREMQEELGLEVEVSRMVWVSENFFEQGGKTVHELGLYYLMEVPLEPSSQPFVLSNLTFAWFPLSQLHGLNLQPEFLKTTLKALPVRAKHIVRNAFSAEPPTAEPA